MRGAWRHSSRCSSSHGEQLIEERIREQMMLVVLLQRAHFVLPIVVRAAARDEHIADELEDRRIVPRALGVVGGV
jgi:hypothetical protein